MVGKVEKILMALLGALIAMMAVPAWADDDEAPRIDSVSEDLGFGEQELSDEARLGEPGRIRGRVDQRFLLNPLADRLLSWPTGYIAPRGSVTLSNQNFLGQRINVSVADSVQLFAMAYLPWSSQTYMSGGGQMHIVDGAEWKLTVGVLGRYRRTNYMPGTADAGLGVHAVFDVVATNNTTWSAGVAANIPVYRVVEEVDYSDCETRREMADNECGTIDRRGDMAPNSGYWGSIFVGVNHFVTDQVILNAEAFTGASQGNFFAMDSALDPDLSYSQERALVEDSSWDGGLGPLGVFTLGLGSTWRLGPVALQTALYFTNYSGQAQILPYLSVGWGLGRD